MLAEITGITRSVLRDPDLEISVATTLDDIPGWDSMVLITVVVEAECRLGVMFEASEIDALRTVGDLARTLAEKQARAAA
ncbi:MAG TPA: acyl carrier protein [Acetobacteraceae bacterium]